VFRYAPQKTLELRFTGKKELNDLLRTEQKYICCYCQQRVGKFKQNNNGNSHNEHLVPQRGVNGNATLQMVYTKYLCKL
jgi:hypothetical protein